MQLKYMTVNIWNGGKLFDNLAAFLKKENPDILALQEVYNEHDETLERRYRTLDELQKVFPYPYAVFAPAFRKHETSGIIAVQGNAVLSRFPITAQNITFYEGQYKDIYGEHPEEYPFYPRNLEQAVIDVKGKTIQVFNTHGIWGKDGEDNQQRLHMSEVIIDQIKHKERIILSGDTNTAQHTRAITNIEAYITNVFKDELVSSFNMKQKTDGGYATAVVDFIFVSRDIKVVSHYMPDVDVSDHMPLVAILEI